MLLQRPRSPQSCHQFIHQKPSPLYMRKIWWQTQIRFRPIRNRKQKCTIWSSDVPIPQQPFTRKNNDPREMVIRRISCLHSSTSSRMDQQYVIRHDKFRRLPRHDILRPHIPQELQTSKIPTQKWPILKTQTTQIQHRLLRIKLAFPYLDIGLRPFHLETSGGESLDRKSGDFRHSSYILYISTHFIFSYYTHQKAWQRDDEFESFANDRISSSL